MIDKTTAAHPPDVIPEAIAGDMLSALASVRQIAPVTAGDRGFDLKAAYRVADAVRRRREARGERIVGRKVGFTNRTIWDEYGVHAPIWGYVYDTTLQSPDDLGKPLAIGHLVEPRIEPEIMFGIASAPHKDMDDTELMACMGWVAHGFEIVQSLFPGWKFRAADTVAAFALHGALVVGRRTPVTPASAPDWIERLVGFDVTLLRNGLEMDHGNSVHVLGGGPLSAVRHLLTVLADDPDALPLAAGEIVSTGTLTRALPVSPGETWSTRLEDVPLPGMTLALTR